MVQPWLTRSFEREHPIALHPNLRARLRGSPARAHDLIQGVDDRVLTARPGGAWSVLDHIGHLADLDALFAARLDDYDAGRDVLTPWDGTNAETDAAGHHARPAPEVIARFRGTRAGILSTLDRLDDDDFARTAEHPRLGQPMRMIDLLAFHSEHDDHHLARIHELIAAGARDDS